MQTVVPNKLGRHEVVLRRVTLVLSGSGEPKVSDTPNSSGRHSHTYASYIFSQAMEDCAHAIAIPFYARSLIRTLDNLAN